MLFLFFLCVVSATPLGVKVELDVASDNVAAAMITLTSETPLFLLNWNSPLHKSFHGNWLHVKDVETNEILKYVGPKARFVRTPTAESYTEIEGGMRQIQLSFKRDYEFVHGRTYELQAQLHFLDAVGSVPKNRSAANFESLMAVVTSPVRRFRFGGHISSTTKEVTPEHSDAINFKKCTPTEEQASKAGHIEASKQADAGKRSVGSDSTGGPLYKTWFGSGNTYLSRVRGVIGTTYTWLVTYANSTIDCKGAECEPDVYAYVFPNDRTQTIYFCGAYWSSPLYEQGNTWTHEIAHFAYIGGTDDYAYGQSACKKLAQSKPAQATENSDNYSYFCELANTNK